MSKDMNHLVLVAKGLVKTYGQGPTAVDVLKSVDLEVSVWFWKKYAFASLGWS
jgi:lipoprotein-releasing system ATP-binding protein